MAGVIDTTYTFANNDTITSSKMNNIIDETTFTSTAIYGSTLQVASGKLAINASGVTSNELANNAVTSIKITDLSVTPAKLSTGAPVWDSSGTTIPSNAITGTYNVNFGTNRSGDGDTVIQIGAETGNTYNATITRKTGTNGAFDFVQTGTGLMTFTAPSGFKFKDAPFPNPSGTAPVYGARAWVNFDATTALSPAVSGTYSRSGTTVTVICAGHGLKTGSLVNLDFTSGAAVDGVFTITGVSTTTVADDTFTVTHGTSGTTSGNVTLPRWTIKTNGSGNVSSVSDLGTGVVAINFTTEMPTANYAICGYVQYNSSDAKGLITNNSSATQTTWSSKITTVNSNSASLQNCPAVHVIFFA
jgi:hypothetical protein